MKTFEYFYFSAGENDKGEFVLTYQGEELNYGNFFHPVISKLGSEGWELINVLPLTASEAKSAALIPFFAKADTFVSLTYTSGQVFYFKRELNDKALNFKNSVYASKYQYLEEIDNRANKKDILKKQDEDLMQQVVDLGVANDMNGLIKKYEEVGYYVKFQHKDRLIFEKDMREVRYDRNLDTGVWTLQEL